MLERGNILHFSFQSLNNQNVYSGCCTLRLSDTKMKDLDVKSNSDKARDYTKEPPQFIRSAPRLDNIPIFSKFAKLAVSVDGLPEHLNIN